MTTATTSNPTTTHQAGSIEIKSGKLSASISPTGAWLESLSLEDRKIDLLFPKQTLRGENGRSSVRGGLHVMLPQAGPDHESSSPGLPQHGFGRVLPWQVTDQKDGMVTLRLTIDDDCIAKNLDKVPALSKYCGLQATLVYKISAEPSPTLDVTLTLENRSDKPMRLAPGFHPYFIVPEGVGLDEIQRSNNSSGDARPVGTVDPSTDHPFNPAGEYINFGSSSQIYIGGSNTQRIAFWSDKADSYVCIEPIQHGPVFKGSSTGENEEYLAPGQHSTVSMRTVWTKIEESKSNQGRDAAFGKSEPVLSLRSENYGSDPVVNAVASFKLIDTLIFDGAISDGVKIKLADGQEVEAKKFNLDLLPAGVSLAEWLNSYVKVHNQMINAAIDRLVAGDFSPIEAKPRFTPPGSAFDANLDDLRRSMIHAIHQQACNPSEAMAAHMAECMASMALRIEQQRIAVLEKLNSNTEIRQVAKITETAFVAAREKGGSLQEQFAFALNYILDKRYEMFGRVPRLELWNDMDDTLGHNASNCSLNPPHALDTLLDNTLQILAAIPGRQRVPIFHNWQHVNDEAGRYAAFNAGYKIPIFSDVAAVARLASEVKANFHIITASPEDVAVGAAHLAGVPDAKIIGTTPSSIGGHEKPMALLEHILQDPCALVVLSDDRDTGCRDAIKAGSVLGGLKEALPLENILFFVARGTGTNEGRSFAMAELLNTREVPHELNVRVEHDNDKFNGYQGTAKVISIYQDWLKRRGLSV